MWFPTHYSYLFFFSPFFLSFSQGEGIFQTSHPSSKTGNRGKEERRREWEKKEEEKQDKQEEGVMKGCGGSDFYLGSFLTSKHLKPTFYM